MVRSFVNKWLRKILVSVAICIISIGVYAKDRLLGNISMTGIEGSSGGVIVPWATIGKGDGSEPLSVAVGASVAETDDYSMDSLSTYVGVVDWLEVSFARLSIQRDQAADVVRQNVMGIKMRLNEGYVYETPLWSIGLQHKFIDNSNDFSSLGFADKSGTDFYIAGTYMPLASFFNRNLIYAGALRYTKANQLGLLGFGSTDSGQDEYELVAEISLALQLNSRILVGAEYRDKPDNLSASPEDEWNSLYVSYQPVSQVSIALSWLDLGEIFGGDEQQGALLGLEASF